MNRLFYKFAVLVAISLLLCACGQKSPGLQEGAASPDKILFDNGMKFLKKARFTRARLTFQTLINTYPESEYTPVAFLAIADSYYDEGGVKNLLQAENQYKDFIIFYPTHDMADDVYMKTAAINFRLMKSPDRDPTYGRKAESSLSKFLEDYPSSELVPTAREVLVEVRENLALGTHSVGMFYFKRGVYSASESRLKEVLEVYPDFSRSDQTLFTLGKTLERLGRIEEASVYYVRLAAGYPFSDYFDSAKQKLTLLEKPVPPVDEVAAARNKGNRNNDEFSIFDPLRSVVSALKGRQDPYKTAKKRAKKSQEERLGQE